MATKQGPAGTGIRPVPGGEPAPGRLTGAYRRASVSHSPPSHE